MRLQDIMSRAVKTVAPSAGVAEAASLMNRNLVHHLVVKDGSRVVGIVSARDLGRRSDAVTRDRTVADVMTRHVITAKPSTTVKQAANLLRGHIIGCLPVIEDGRVRGVVSTADLLELIGRGSARPERRVARPPMRRKMIRTVARRG